jgi:putative flippase GtrA
MIELLINCKYKNLLTQLFSFALVGILSNIMGYGLYLLFTYLGVSPKVTMSILYAIGAVLGFFGNRVVTFKDQGCLLGTAFRYTVAHCCGYLINLLMLIILVDKFGYNHQWVQALAILIVAACLFILFKFFVFRHVNVPMKKEQ